MQKRKLRIVKQSPQAIGVCERCNENKRTNCYIDKMPV
jgi:hypothetical protein